MLFVNARAAPSSIHGLVLFAREFIPTGALVWKFTPDFDVVIPEHVFERLPPHTQEQVRHYAYFDHHQIAYVLSSDDDRFTNHADDPNTRDEGSYTYARRDIRAGEEITCDYREINMVDIPFAQAA